MVYAYGEEDTYREKVFYENVRQIQEHNSNSNRTFDKAVNVFAAMTHPEWMKLYIHKRNKYSTVDQQQVITPLSKVVTVPAGPVIDWQAQGAVTRVISQGSCNAMYAFAAVGATEGLAAIFFRTSIQLSAQQVVDCSDAYGNDGCNDGSVDNALDFVVARGLMSESQYPYNGQVLSCKYQSGTFRGATVYRHTAGCDDLALVLTQQPVAVAIDGSSIMYYSGGLFGDCDQDPNFPLLLTGMTDSYWRMKASIGVEWGEKGYIRIVRGNSCGVCMAGVFPRP